MIISTSTSEAAAAIRAFQWPVLEAGNRAFMDGVYTVEVEHRERGRSFTLSHRVAGAPLLQRWVQDGKVRFVCAAAAPVSAYRTLHASSDSSHVVEWHPDDLGSPPVFTPTIVAAAEMRYTINAYHDGLNPLWDGREVELPRGARLAIGPSFAFQSGLQGLLVFRDDEQMGAGQFRVEPSNEGGFQFNVHLATDLYRFLVSHRHEAAGWNVMTGIVSAAFARLQKDYAGDDGEVGWKSHPNLIMLAEDLERRGLPMWTDEAFQPEVAATTLYPLRAVVYKEES